MPGRYLPLPLCTTPIGVNHRVSLIIGYPDLIEKLRQLRRYSTKPCLKLFFDAVEFCWYMILFSFLPPLLEGDLFDPFRGKKELVAQLRVSNRDLPYQYENFLLPLISLEELAVASDLNHVAYPAYRLST